MNRDPERGPGVAGTPVPAGISLHHMDKAMRAAFGGLRVRPSPWRSMIQNMTETTRR